MARPRLTRRRRALPLVVPEHYGGLRSTFRIRRALRQAMLIDLLRFAIALVRFAYFAGVRRRLQTLDPDGYGVSANTIRHNLRGLRDLAVVRSSLLIRPLSVIESLGPDARILVIGPRSEGEILNLVAHGFKRRNIRGVDLISYSPWVDAANMHALPYERDSWDATVLGWVLAYSIDPALAAKEVTRVTRPGGIVAVAVEHNPLTDDQISERVGYTVGAGFRLGSVEEILALFGDSVGTVYFSHDVVPARRDRLGVISTIFSITKEPAE